MRLLRKRNRIEQDDCIAPGRWNLFGKTSAAGRRSSFFVYGRGLLFLDAYYLLAETVNNNTWRPITSVMIDIHRGKYAGLEHRYSRISVEEKGIELKNGHDGHSLRLQDVHGLKWIQL